MPTPDRTSLDAIVAVARDLLETEGLAGLTMQAVAHRVGVRAPSLYKRVRDRDQLIQLLVEMTLTDLADQLSTAQGPRDVMNGFRSFSHERPAAFRLALAPGPHSPTARDETWAASSDAVVRVARELTNDDHALEAARTLTAWAVGFISLELNSAFKLGGDIDDAWEYGLTKIIAAITADRSA